MSWDHDGCPGLDVLSPFADGELPPVERVAIEIHLRECEACRRRFDELRSLDLVLAGSVAARRRSRGLLFASLAAAASLGIFLTTQAGEAPAPPKEMEVAVAPDPEPVRLEELEEEVALLVQAEAAGEQGVADRLRDLGLAARPALHEWLRSASTVEAAAALRLVRGLQDRSALPVVVELLDHPFLEEKAAFVLGELGQRRALPHLEYKFREGAPARTVAHAIAKGGGEVAARILDDLMQDEWHPDRRAALVQGLGLLPARLGLPSLVRSLDDESPLVGGTAFQELQRRRRDYLPLLRSRLSGRGAEAETAVRILGRLRDGHSVAALAECLHAPGCRREAAEALVRIGGVDALERVFRVATPRADDPLAPVFAAASDRVETFLIGKLTDGRFDEREKAAALLGLHGGPSAVAALTEAAREPALGPVAIRALGALGRRTPEAVLALLEAAGRSDLRFSAIEALGETRRVDAVESLVALASDRSSGRAVVDALSRIERPESVRALVGLWRQMSLRRVVESGLRRFDAELLRSVLAESSLPPRLSRALGWARSDRRGGRLRRPGL